MFLYDVTSSYLEGEQNELAEYGYNRDKKRGKKQIVIGLLCDENGARFRPRFLKGILRTWKPLAHKSGRRPLVSDASG